jgi:hypothetical protein
MTEFAVLFITWFVAHTVGDHWVQSSSQSKRKGQRNRDGVKACSAHVASLTATKVVFTAVAWVALDLGLTPGVVALAMALDAGSHYWADRRYTLARLADKVGKGEFYRLGSNTVNAEGEQAFHIGTGAYALDQAWHHAWLFIAALVAVSF